MNIGKWLRNLAPEIRACLGRVAGGDALERSALERLASCAGGKLLLVSCASAGLLSPAAPQYERIEARLERYCVDTPARIRVLLQQYWRFYLRPAIALRAYRPGPMNPRLDADWDLLKVAFDFLSDLEARNITLRSLSQADVDRWLAPRARWKGAKLGRFLCWLQGAYQLSHELTVPKRRLSDACACSEPVYLQTLQRAQEDRGLPLAVRVALLIMTRCGKSMSELVVIRLRDLTIAPSSVTIRFAKGVAQTMDGKEAALIRQLAGKSHNWLFEVPGGKPYAAGSLRNRIHFSGITVDLRALQNAARRQMLEVVEPGDLVRILGHHPAQADVWRRRLAL